MKFTWKVAIVLAAVLCLTAVLIACNDDEGGFVYVTDEAGEVVTDAAGEPVTEPDADGDGVGDGTTDPSPESTVSLEEINEESDWSEMFRP